MFQLHDGQCGLCKHFGEHSAAAAAQDAAVIQIRQSKEAPEDLIEECGHPKHAALHLVVTPGSGCDGFERAQG